MNLKEYQTEINKTWKTNPGMGDYEHCLVGIMEEAGEIAGWYKKANYYGIGMTEEISRGLKGELGDLFYYLNEMTMLIGDEGADVDVQKVDPESSTLSLLIAMNSAVNTLMTESPYSQKHTASRLYILRVVRQMAENELWSGSDIMYSNIAKLKHRHGSDFDIDKAEPSNRDIVGEDGQLEMSLPTSEKPKKKSALKSLRKKAGFSQSQVATVLGVSTSHICRLEQGNTKLKNKFIPILAKLYKCPKNVIEQYA
jgi:DNA-binding transcriptional regulator YiaG/NTP pyrophosphatase (non-canonical NTP hydrolase)